MIKYRLTPKIKFYFLLFDLFALVGLYAGIFVVAHSYFEVSIFYDYRLWLIVSTLLACLYIFGCYDLDSEIDIVRLLSRVGLAFVGAILVSTLVYYLVGNDRSGLFGRKVLFGTLTLFFFVSFAYRAILNLLVHKMRGDDAWLFLVNAEYYSGLRDDIERFCFPGKKVYLIDDTGLVNAQSDAGVYSIKDLPKFIEKKWTSIVVAVDEKSISSDMSKLLMRTRFSGVKIYDLSVFYEELFLKVPVNFLNHNWFILSKGFAIVNNPIGLRAKRLLDLLISLSLLMVLWPLMLLTALLVKLESRGPVFYQQVRAGLGGELFKIFKFRSMRVDAEANGAQWASVNDSRVTRVGKFIRLTRLDELPQLFNVIRGEMSFVGPRPERPEFERDLETKIPFYKLRHMVRPGITGWAQVRYPYGASVEDAKEKLQYDLYYIKHYSLALDLLIVLRTISVVLLGSGR